MDFSSSNFLLCSANRDRIGPYNEEKNNNNRIGPGSMNGSVHVFIFPF